MQIIQLIQNRIYEIKGERVILDRDWAALDEVETRVFNQSVKRNLKRFPKGFMFRLTKKRVWRFEISIWKILLRENDLKEQIKQIRERIGEHDAQLSQVYDALENLIDEKAVQKKWEERNRIGFKK